MNIFFLDEDPIIAAQMNCDKHVVKIILECGQMMENKTWKNHPMTKWVNKSYGNFYWTWTHYRALLDEYTYRYGKTHAWDNKQLLHLSPDPIEIPEYPTLPPLCMPEMVKIIIDDGDYWNTCVQSYRNYYIECKQHLATWKRRGQPYWWRSK